MTQMPRSIDSTKCADAFLRSSRFLSPEGSVWARRTVTFVFPLRHVNILALRAMLGVRFCGGKSISRSALAQRGLDDGSVARLALKELGELLARLTLLQGGGGHSHVFTGPFCSTHRPEVEASRLLR